MLGSKWSGPSGEPLENLSGILPQGLGLAGPTLLIPDLSSTRSPAQGESENPQMETWLCGPLWGTQQGCFCPCGPWGGEATRTTTSDPDSPCNGGRAAPSGLPGVWLSITHEEIPSTRTPRGLLSLSSQEQAEWMQRALVWSALLGTVEAGFPSRAMVWLQFH